jgi:hypothetical protein
MNTMDDLSRSWSYWRVRPGRDGVAARPIRTMTTGENAPSRDMVEVLARGDLGMARADRTDVH